MMMGYQAGLMGIVKLNGENWTTWKFQVEITMKSKRFFDVVNATIQRPATNADDWDSKDAKAQEIIVSRLDDEILTHTLSCKTSAEMWTKLKAIYEHKSQVLMSLPESLKHFISAWESSPADKQPLTDLMSRLMIEEESSKNAENCTALAVKGKFFKSKNDIKCFECNKMGHVKKDCHQVAKKVCHFCKKPGHRMQDCWFKKAKEGKEIFTKCSDIMATLGKDNLKINNCWMDSGATEHMCFDKEQFRWIGNVPEKRQVRVGTGTSLEVQGIGIVEVMAWNGNEWMSTDLYNENVKSGSQHGWQTMTQVKVTSEEEPVSLEEAMSGRNNAEWKQAIEKELSVLRENDTWTEVSWPVNEKVIESKWVFEEKREK
ncbi:hypothetical protein JTB14_020127 [Gonioctena quinquepunctata]|nr:hypothetical protein JTB14_020127 [Gonioctena quinquepunctata]